MPAVMRHLPIPLAILLGVAAVPLAQAQNQPGSMEMVTLRAIGPHFTDETVKYLAANAEPFRFDKAAAKAVADSTPREVIVNRCGNVRASYVTAFMAANDLKAPPENKPLRDKAGSFVWPACLYAKTFPDGFKAKVKEGDTASEIYERLTGGGGSKAALRKYFNMNLIALNRLQPDQVLAAAHATVPVSFTPVRGIDTNTFLVGLAKTTGKATDAQKVIRELGRQEPGEIVLGIPKPATGEVASTTGQCRKPSGPPFDAKALELAYRFAAKRRLTLDTPLSAGRADVAIVDNGFFGASTQTNPSNPFEGSPFPRVFFDLDDRTTVLKRMEFGPIVSLPLNVQNDIEPTLTSGHGTHVAGLVLGGPTIENFRDAWQAEHEPWAKVAIFNIARGTKQLIQGSAASLASAMNTGFDSKIVNMSLAHDGQADRDVQATYFSMFRLGFRSLFVVAAGNGNGKDVRASKVYPAAYGGESAVNVITVAALDGDEGLAPFSNKSPLSVDMAAPGCEIESWMSTSHDVTSLSGTSQAAPQVTFELSLLKSLDSGATPRALKQRAVISGELLTRGDVADFIVYRVKPNPAKALYWFDDYLQASGEEAGQYLGRIEALDGLRCKSDPADTDPMNDFLAFKQANGAAYVFKGRSNFTLPAPCPVQQVSDGTLVFVATHRIERNSIEILPTAKQIKINLAQVVDLILHAEQTNR